MINELRTLKLEIVGALYNPMPDHVQDSRKVGDFFDLEFELGELKNRHSGRRMLALPLSSWVTLNSALRQSFGDGATAYMHQIGYSIGISIAHESRERNTPPSESLKILVSSAMFAGWGKFTIMGDTAEGIRFSAKVENCPSCFDEQPGSPPLCDMLVGMLNGLVDEVFRKPHLVTEYRCGYKKDNVCEFSILQTHDKSEEQKHWASYVIFPWHRSKR
jgi:predicted hydrocarbon binding protein